MGRRRLFRWSPATREHPITAGLPEVWMHSSDELYSKLRGPAKNLTLLATAKGDPAQGATGEDEPALMAIRFGKGRIFHTTLGHDAASTSLRGLHRHLPARRGVGGHRQGDKYHDPGGFPWPRQSQHPAIEPSLLIGGWCGIGLHYPDHLSTEVDKAVR